MTDDINDVSHTSTLAKFEEVVRRNAQETRPSVPHVLNEWADLGCNALQWLRNIKDGISTPDDALAEMKSNYDRVIEMSRAVEASPRSGQTNIDKADYKIGWWLSGALEDPAVCAEMKADINAWFEAHQPGLKMEMCTSGPSPGATALEIAQALFEETHEEPWEQGMQDTRAIYLEEAEGLLKKFAISARPSAERGHD